MRRFVQALFFFAALLAGSAVHAQRHPVPIIDRPNVPAVSGSGKPLSPEELTQAIVNGGANGPRKWSVVPAGDGKLRGTYMVRTHTVVV